MNSDEMKKVIHRIGLIVAPMFAFLYTYGMRQYLSQFWWKEELYTGRTRSHIGEMFLYAIASCIFGYACVSAFGYVIRCRVCEEAKPLIPWIRATWLELVNLIVVLLILSALGYRLFIE